MEVPAKCLENRTREQLHLWHGPCGSVAWSPSFWESSCSAKGHRSIDDSERKLADERPWDVSWIWYTFQKGEIREKRVSGLFYVFQRCLERVNKKVSLSKTVGVGKPGGTGNGIIHVNVIRW